MLRVKSVENLSSFEASRREKDESSETKAEVNMAPNDSEKLQKLKKSHSAGSLGNEMYPSEGKLSGSSLGSLSSNGVSPVHIGLSTQEIGELNTKQKGLLHSPSSNNQPLDDSNSDEIFTEFQKRDSDLESDGFLSARSKNASLENPFLLHNDMPELRSAMRKSPSPSVEEKREASLVSQPILTSRLVREVERSAPDLIKNRKLKKEYKIKKKLSWYDQLNLPHDDREKSEEDAFLAWTSEELPSGGGLGRDENHLAYSSVYPFGENHSTIARKGSLGSKDKREHFESEKQFKDIEEQYFNGVYETGETDREMVKRVASGWRLQDDLSQVSPSMISNVLWGPVLLYLKVLHICFQAIFICFSFVPKFAVPVAREGFTPESVMFYGRRCINRARIRSLDISFEEKKQTALVMSFVLIPLSMGIIYWYTLLLLLFPLTTFPTAVYLAYIFFWDKSPETGERVAFMRYWSMWRHFVNYFPIRLVKTYNLDPRKKYVFCYHPHGIISFGAFGNFATDATGFKRLFPGVDLRLLTLKVNFYIPLIREWLLSMGMCCCSQAACDNILEKGSSIMLVVGGAAESLLSSPGTYRLKMNQRKGFVRVAIANQAELVPVLGFGENDAFDTSVQNKDTLLGSLQLKFKNTFGFAVPLYWGRGITAKEKKGVLPHRKPIIAVVGKPIPCPKLPEHLKGSDLRTSAEGQMLVERYHTIYIHAMKELYEANKEVWAKNREESLRIVDRSRTREVDQAR